MRKWVVMGSIVLVVGGVVVPMWEKLFSEADTNEGAISKAPENRRSP